MSELTAIESFPQKLAATIGLLALVLTKTRTAWAGFAGGAFVLVVWAVRHRHLDLGKLVMLGCAVLLAVLVGWPAIASRFDSAHGYDFNVRWNLIRVGLEMMAVGISSPPAPVQPSGMS